MTEPRYGYWCPICGTYLGNPYPIICNICGYDGINGVDSPTIERTPGLMASDTVSCPVNLNNHGAI